MPDYLRFTEHLVMDGFGYAYGISVADLTGKGRLDLIAADTDIGMYWFENDGHGHFTKRVIRWQPGEWLERHAIADINGDGQLEVVSIDNINGCVLWLGYHGDPRDVNAWQHHYIAECELPGAYDLTVADLDGDGDLDVAASSWRKGNRFTWYENRDGQWVTHLIDADNVPETRTICAADFNGDGKVDLLGTARMANQVMWYENSGDPARTGWRKHLIDGAAFSPCHGHPVDMDGDGDLDVIMALGMMPAQNPADYGQHQIVWYENDGQPARGPWQKHVICESFPCAFEAVAADLDGDGQMEVVASAWGDDGRIALFKHRGDPRGPWGMQMIKTSWRLGTQVLVADLDGDGRLDIAASAERGTNELRWWHNDGPAANP